MVCMTKSSKSDTTVTKTLTKRQKAVQLQPYKWQPGVSANPKGRPKGTRNKFAEAFIKDFLADWEMGGPSAIQACRLDDPAAYLRIAASIVPKEFNLKDKDGESILDTFIEQLPSEQLASFIAALAAPSTGAQGQGDKAKEDIGS
jgi:hypothetical protein